MFLLLIIAAIALVLLALGVDLGVILAIVLIIVAIMFLPAVAGVIGTLFPGTLIAGVVGAGSYVMSGLALLLAWMVDSETVEGVIDDAGELVEKVGEVAIDAGNSIVGSLLSSPVGIAALCVGGLFLYNALSSSDSSSVEDRAATAKRIKKAEQDRTKSGNGQTFLNA